MAASLTISLCLIALLLPTTIYAESNHDASDNFPCLQSLLPCAGDLKSPKPSPACCAPLDVAIEKDVNCLCDLFNNQEILNNFNVTQDEALQLPKRCGMTADLSKCKKTSSGGSGDKAPPSPSNPAPSTPSKTPSKGSTSNSGRLSLLSHVAVFILGGMVYLFMSV